MAGFGESLMLFAQKVEGRQRDIFVGCATEIHRSVTDGSEITTAPGQPVDTGFLKGSWQLTFPDEWTAEIATNVGYAPVIEEGGDKTEYDARGVQRPSGLVGQGKSPVGGPHSVKLTRSNWDRIVQVVTRNVVGG